MDTVTNPMSDTQPKMDTSQQINHVYACYGPVVHVTPGITLLRSGDITRCPQCGARVSDCTNSFLGQSYIAFARLDLGERP